MDVLHLSLSNCEDVAGTSRANTHGRVKKGPERRVLYARRPAYAGNGKKGDAILVKIPKHNVTVLFSAAGVNMRDYELLVRLGNITLDTRCICA